MRWWLCILLVFGASACFTFGVEESKTTIVEEATNPAWLELELDVGASVDELRVVGDLLADGQVEATARLSALTSDGKDTVFDGFEMTLTDTAPVVTLGLVYEGNNAEQVSVESLSLRADQNMLLRARNPSLNELRVENLRGGLDIEARSTDLVLVQCGFGVVETSSGRITVTNSEEGDYRSSSGTIDITLDAPVVDGELYIETNSGDIAIELPRGYGWTFEFDVLGGPIDFAVDTERFVHEPELAYQDRFTTGGGGMRIVIVTDTGSVTVYD